MTEHFGDRDSTPPAAGHDAPPADLAESMRLIAAGRAAAARRLQPDPRLIFWPWAFSWIISFGLYFLHYGPGGRVFVDLPGWVPGATLAATLVGAGVVAGLAGARAYRHVFGNSSIRGAMYGWTWLLGYLAMGVILGRITPDLPAPEAGLLWAAAAVGVTGLLHAAGGAIWLDRNLFALGAWITVTNLAGVLAGPGWHSLVTAVAGGGGLLVAGLLAWRRWRAVTA
ncbi:transporter [Rhizomonospora bruguierae]|uniref:transporter n=1 Tax=Rhizomonospora bruguierae TaxID=1581705 RepID=UPI0020BE3621|nr:transporter [Micromonospora sp. NBRC 107566]